MTGLEHTDRIAALKPGAWIMAACRTQVVMQKGGMLEMDIGQKARVVDYFGVLNVDLESGKRVSIFRDDFADWDVPK